MLKTIRTYVWVYRFTKVQYASLRDSGWSHADAKAETKRMAKQKLGVR